MFCWWFPSLNFYEILCHYKYNYKNLSFVTTKSSDPKVTGVHLCNRVIELRINDASMRTSFEIVKLPSPYSVTLRRRIEWVCCYIWSNSYVIRLWMTVSYLQDWADDTCSRCCWGILLLYSSSNLGEWILSQVGGNLFLSWARERFFLLRSWTWLTDLGRLPSR